MTTTREAALFKALGDATRLAVVARLAKGPATVSGLGRDHDMTLTGLAKHLAVLERAGIVARRKVGRDVTCTLVPGALAEAGRWLHDRLEFWTRSLDRLEAVVTAPPRTSSDAGRQGVSGRSAPQIPGRTNP